MGFRAAQCMIGDHRVLDGLIPIVEVRIFNTEGVTGLEERQLPLWERNLDIVGFELGIDLPDELVDCPSTVGWMVDIHLKLHQDG